MTKDVIELAREAGIAMYPLDDDYCDAVGLERGTICRVPDIGIEELNRLAALVAARERERIANLVLTTDAWRNAGWVSTICPTTKHAIAAAIRALNTEGEGNDPITG